MKKLVYLFILCYVLLSVNFVYAERDILKEKLKNGMTVIIEEDHSAPLVALQAFVKAGSITEGKYLGTGISHYFEHMLFKGTKKLKVGDFAKILKKNGASNLNAYTANDRTVYHFNLPSENFDIGLEILSDALMNASLPEEEAKKEKKVILKEINMGEDNPNRKFWQKTVETLFKVHPYRYPVIGYTDTFKSITRNEIMDYFKRMYTPNNMIFVVVGDVDKYETLAKLKKAFKNFKRGREVCLNLSKEPEQVMPRRTVFEEAVKVARMRLVYPTIPLKHKDLYALDVLSLIFGSGDSSVISKKLKDKLQLVYSVGSSSWTPHSVTGAFIIQAVLNPKNLSKVEKIIIKELNKFKKHKVSQKQLQKAINQVIAYKYFSSQKFDQKAGTLGLNEIGTGNIYFDSVYIKGIKSVTANDIIRVAKKYFIPEKLNVITMKPKIKTNKRLKKLRLVKNRLFIDSVKKIKLDNGIVVLINENKKIPLVHLDVVFNGGLRLENENNNGITSLMANMMLKGTKKRKAMQIIEKIDFLGANIKSYSGNFSFGFELDILKDNLKTGLDILSDVVKNPIFPKTEFKKLKTNVIAGLKSKKEDIWYQSSRLMNKTFFKNHFYGLDVDGSIKSVEKITVEDIKAHYKQHVVPENMVISIAGDIEKADIINQLKKYFGKLKKIDYKHPVVPDQPDISKVEKVTKVMKGKKQAIFNVTFKGPHLGTDEEITATVLTTAISGLGSRLFRNLRGKKSLAYSVGCYNVGKLNAGLINFFIGTVPDRVDEALKGMLIEIKDVKKNSITKEELERAKNQLIGSFKNGLQTISQQSKSIVYNELYGFGYDFKKDLIKKIKAVTLKDVKDLANKYLDLNKYVFSVVGPKY